MRKQLLEQPIEQHRIGDVVHVEFIEAQQPQSGFDDRLDHRLDRVGIPALGAFAKRRHAGMHLIHEFMEMHPPLFADRHRRIEQIHQHGLAAPDLTVEVQSLDRRRLVEQPPEQALGALGHQPRQHAIQQCRRVELRRIGDQHAILGQLGIGRTDRTGRQGRRGFRIQHVRGQSVREREYATMAMP